jgi:soluble lytic murein transglycosylase-like protein
MKALCVALILELAPAYGIPPYLLVAIAETESQWNNYAQRRNNNGTIDRGIMQLNSSWFEDDNWHDPVVNINAAIDHILGLRKHGLNWWQTVMVYNCGLSRLNNPPEQSIEYAAKVFRTWASYDKYFNNYVGR